MTDDTNAPETYMKTHGGLPDPFKQIKYIRADIHQGRIAALEAERDTLLRRDEQDAALKREVYKHMASTGLDSLAEIRREVLADMMKAAGWPGEQVKKEGE